MRGELEALPKLVTGLLSAVPLIKAQAAKASQGERRFIFRSTVLEAAALLPLVVVNDLEFCINDVAFRLLG